MKKSKLFSLLSTFSNQEMKQFEKFIISPFFNNERNFKPLFTILKKYHPSFDNQDLSEANIFKILYPGKVFDKKASSSLRVLESQLTVLVLKFLKYNNDNSGVNEKISNINFLRVLNQRKLDNLFTSNLKALEKSLDTEIDPEQSLFSQRMKLEAERCSFFLSRDRQQETSEYLQKQSEYFIYYILSELFKLKQHLQINKYVFNAEFKVNVFAEFFDCVNFEKIIEYLRINNTSYYPVIGIYYYCIFAQMDIKNESNYQNFKTLVEENIDLFTDSEKYVLLQNMTSCCWQQMRSLKNHNESHREIFRIHKYLLENNLYKYEKNGFIRLSFFRNVIINALNVKEIEWLNIFVNKYTNELAPEHRENMYNYGMAIVFFEKGEYEKSLENITKIKYEYFYFRVDVKTWQLRIYYELNLYHNAVSLIDTFKHFISKNRILSEELGKPVNEFLKFYVKLFKIKNGDDSIPLNKLESDISNIPHLSHKNWILRKIDELRNPVVCQKSNR